jgi:hypothetical protein
MVADFDAAPFRLFKQTIQCMAAAFNSCFPFCASHASIVATMKHLLGLTFLFVGTLAEFAPKLFR